jgi:hypothetical protein
MPSPVTPNEIKNTLPNVDSGVCDRLKKVIIDFPRKIYAWFSYIYNDDGTFTEEFKQELCAVNCDDIIVGPNQPGGGNGGDGGGEGGTLRRVTNLIATPATRAQGGIMLMWPNDSVAEYVTVYRTPTVVVNHGTPGSTYAANSTNINVEPLVETIQKDKKIHFDNGTILTATAKADKDATVIACTLSGTLPDNEEGKLPAEDATIIRNKESIREVNIGWQTTIAGIPYRRGDSCCYIDKNATAMWDGSEHRTHDSEGNVANVLDGALRYNYWISTSDSSNNYSAFSNVTAGFSKYVKGFSTNDASVELCYSGGGDTYYDQAVLSSLTYPNSSKSYMRVVLRGGGGGGGAGGDHLSPSTLQYYIKTFTYTDASSEMVVTLASGSDIQHWSVNDEVKVVDNGTSAYNKTFTVSEIMTQTQGQFKLSPVDMSGASPQAQAGGFNIPGTSDPSFGRIHRVKDKQKVRTHGGGGGAGGFLMATFAISNAITKVRVRTIDSTGTPNTVNYSDTGSNPVNQLSVNFANELGKGDIPFNIGGTGRNSNTSHPTAGEPSTNPWEEGAHTTVAYAGDPLTYLAPNNNTGYSKANHLAPYFTLLEVYSTSSNSWHEVARVADGQGGGYRNGFSNLISRGGLGGKTYSITTLANHCVHQTNTMTKLTGAKDGKFFKAGNDGEKGETPFKASATSGGDAGKGAHIWDGFQPVGTSSKLSWYEGKVQERSFGNNFDVEAPGGGASGCKGSADEADKKVLHGGYAIAGSAWVSFSDTAYLKY